MLLTEALSIKSLKLKDNIPNLKLLYNLRFKKRKRKKKKKPFLPYKASATRSHISSSTRFPISTLLHLQEQREREREREQGQERENLNSRVRVFPYNLHVVRFRIQSKMGVNSLPSESSNDLDEQIAQLMECKPLSEQQVPFYQILIFLKWKVNLGSVWLPRKHEANDNELQLIVNLYWLCFRLELCVRRLRRY